jgi:disulfide bond formation protein DsbB
MLAQTMNLIWGFLSIVAEILTVVFIAAQFSAKLRKSSVIQFFEDKGLWIAFIVSLLATVGSLIYSDVIGYAPCKLCWYQRIFMYPQVILMGIALYRKDAWIKIYGLVLSILGALMALFHYSGQIGLTPLPCSAVGISVSCSERFVMEFNYITIPMMAFSAFILIASVLALSLRKKEESSLVN